MIKRALQSTIEQYLKLFPAIVLLGPRQVGKTTLAKALAKNIKKEIEYIDLEKISSFNSLKNDPENYLMEHLNSCVIIDEVQRMPTLFPLLRSLIDEKRKPARYIITGSASPDLLKGASESLAGRVVYINLNPIGLHELPSTISIKKHWFRGGFPNALTAKNNDMWHVWIESFITTYIEKDLPFLFDVRFSPIVMRKLWSMLATWHGSIINAEQLGSSLDITGTTLKRYVDFLEGAFVITRLPPFFTNLGKRLVKSPKVYINDTGLLHQLLHITNEKELQHHPLLGMSWEGYVITQIKYAKSNKIDSYFYRTQAGAECDLVLAKGHIVVACVEIKFSKSPTLSKGFFQSIADLKPTKKFVIAQIDKSYTTKDGVIILSVEEFILKYLPKL
jgi:uncharacterized protein